MTTQDIYRLAVRMGALSDLRGATRIKKYLYKVREKYEKLDEEEKREFDTEKLANPYSDTRILLDNNKGEIKKVLVGIDIGGAELMLADKLEVDLTISHHPSGKALASLHDVMDIQAQILSDYGVPINIAESVNKKRIDEVKRSVAPINHNRALDMAKLLNLDLLCTHTVADNLAARYVVNTIKDNEYELDTVEDVVKMIKEIPEYKEAIKHNAGPKIFVGDEENSCGKVVVTEFTGGTSGAKEMYEKMSQAGIGTVISMHMGEKHRKEAEKYHLNVIVAGHMASDSLGMNLFLDEVEKMGVEVISTSGLIRIKRF